MKKNIDLFFKIRLSIDVNVEPTIELTMTDELRDSLLQFNEEAEEAPGQESEALGGDCEPSLNEIAPAAEPESTEEEEKLEHVCSDCEAPCDGLYNNPKIVCGVCYAAANMKAFATDKNLLTEKLCTCADCGGPFEGVVCDYLGRDICSACYKASLPLEPAVQAEPLPKERVSVIPPPAKVPETQKPEPAKQVTQKIPEPHRGRVCTVCGSRKAYRWFSRNQKGHYNEACDQCRGLRVDDSNFTVKKLDAVGEPI